MTHRARSWVWIFHRPRRVRRRCSLLLVLQHHHAGSSQKGASSLGGAPTRRRRVLLRRTRWRAPRGAGPVRGSGSATGAHRHGPFPCSQPIRKPELNPEPSLRLTSRRGLGLFGSFRDGKFARGASSNSRTTMSTRTSSLQVDGHPGIPASEGLLFRRGGLEPAAAASKCQGVRDLHTPILSEFLAPTLRAAAHGGPRTVPAVEAWRATTARPPSTLSDFQELHDSDGTVLGGPELEIAGGPGLPHDDISKHPP